LPGLERRKLVERAVQEFLRALSAHRRGGGSPTDTERLWIPVAALASLELKAQPKPFVRAAIGYARDLIADAR
jgi:hypothetical protein